MHCSSIKRQFNYLCCFNSNIQSLEKEAKDLEDARSELQMKVDAERNNGRVIVPAVETWLADATVRQNNTAEIQTKIPNVQSGRLNIKSRYSLSKKAMKTAADINALRDRRPELDTTSQPARPISEVPILLGPLHEFQSRKQIEEDVMKALRDKKAHIMGICGMGGIGKTTMAKKLMKKAREEKLFDETVITTVSQKVDMSKIQREIADQLGLKDLKDLEGIHARAQKLHSRLMSPKKSLIVLDDIWEDLRLEDLGIPCESGSMGCTVLLTSRETRVLSQMDAKVFTMEILSKDEAWLLFKEKAGTCVDDPKLVLIAKQVAEECKGLPIALVILGSALKNETDGATWSDALHQLKGSHLKNIPSVDKKVYLPLKLSYDFLNKEAKSLFLLCCLFPEDYNIRAEDLTFYCMGLRLFEGISRLEQARNRTSALIATLKSGFLLEGDHGKRAKMHDVVRDVAIAIALEEGPAIVNPIAVSHSHSVYKWISIVVPNTSSVYPDRLMGFNFPCLRLFNIHNTEWPHPLEIKDVSFLDGMEELNVLSFRRTSFRLLPETMQSLKNLRTLIFDSCQLEIENISFVGNVENLEILRCYRCEKIEELPDEMRRLKRLKLLEVSDCDNLKRIAPGVISELVELEELKMWRSFDGWE